MTHPALPALLLFLFAPAAAMDAGGGERVTLTRLTVHRRIIIRIPRMLAHGRSEPKEPRWVEKRGPKCVPAATLIGVVVDETDKVDLMMIDGTRMRARLDDDCPALDFYTGVYIKQSDDGLVCADRDSITARSGSVCAIDGFRRLQLKR